MLNMEFSQRLVIDTATMDWQSSPAAGVLRKPLAREARESGHATSIVQYQPGSRFETHAHPAGEELLVLAGVFSDQNGDFGKGSYIRNPPGTAHAPHSEQGCLLFVKLCQFAPRDEQSLVVDDSSISWVKNEQGLDSALLHQFEQEETRMLRASTRNQQYDLHYPGGAEILVLQGTIADDLGFYQAGCWLRLPPGAQQMLRFGDDAQIWIKTGHLQSVN